MFSRSFYLPIQLFIFAFGVVASAWHESPLYDTRFFEQPVDHFGFSSTGLRLKQRYLISGKHWQEGGLGPILFYAGNEGDIVGFANATGLMWELAPRLRALIVFAESRYYGESQPQPTSTANAQTKYQYLSTQQIIADHAMLIAHLRDTLTGGWDAAVIAVGGSYGGMLAAWLRYQFPHLVDGALAASAPMAGFIPTGVYSIVGRDFDRYGCAENLRHAFSKIWAGRAHESIRAELEASLSICAEPGSSSRLTSASDVETLIGWLQQQLFTLAQLDYPSASHFLGTTLPAHPVKSACAAFNDTLHINNDMVQALGSAVGIAVNFSGQMGPCIRWQTSGATQRLSFKDTLPGFISGAWAYQRCSQVVIPYAVSDSSSAGDPQAFLGCREFSANCWNQTAFAEWCWKKYRVYPRPTAELAYFGGRNISGMPLGGGATNIIFSNGDLDPWGAGGIFANLSKSVVSIFIEGGAHHLDLRYSSPEDPLSVIEARAREEELMQQWVAEKRAKLQSTKPLLIM